MAETAVTQKQWEKVMGRNPSRVKGENLPVTDISYFDAVAFVKKFNDYFYNGREVLQIPSKSQWKIAVCGGTKTAYSFGNDESLLNQYANFGTSRIEPVKTKLPNPYGPYDIHGNLGMVC